jgi:hypothetical protein
MRWVAFVVMCSLACGQTPKNYKDHGEYDLYSEVAKDFAANNSLKALTDLDRWSEKYPESEFKDDRQMLYVQAYSGASEWAKTIDAAAVVLAKDPLPAGNSAGMLRLLYAVVSAIERVPDASAQQVATAAKAAHLIENYDTAPEGVSAAAWASTRSELHATARVTLMYLALLPASRATKAKDCAGAEAGALKAMEAFPESVQAAWLLATAEVCLAKTDPAKASLALYELARAAALDPGKGMVDAKWQQANVIPYLERAYQQFHGADPQGLKELKEMAAQSPLPPAEFVIKSAAEIERSKQMEFESQHPELALWAKIKSALLASDGENYFESELKGSAVPPLQGVVVEAKPGCRVTELRVAIVSLNDAQNSRPEVLLKLQKALTGKVEIGGEVRWSGVATAFSKEPFLLTMEVELSTVEGVKTSPCQPNQRKQAH